MSTVLRGFQRHAYADSSSEEEESSRAHHHHQRHGKSGIAVILQHRAEQREQGLSFASFPATDSHSPAYDGNDMSMSMKTTSVHSRRFESLKTATQVVSELGLRTCVGKTTCDKPYDSTGDALLDAAKTAMSLRRRIFETAGLKITNTTQKVLDVLWDLQRHDAPLAWPNPSEHHAVTRKANLGYQTDRKYVWCISVKIDS